MNNPLILVTNDDGISAPGILHLSSIAKKFGDVYVVAPEKSQSGMGHAITINSSLRIQKTNYHKQVKAEYYCTGTPADCVKMAIHKLLPAKPNLILSGINHGSNSSINVIYSGTMSAAVEGSIEGISSIGFSLCDYKLEANFEASTKYIEQIIVNALKNPLPLGVCLNVNIPAIEKNKIKGIKVCRQAHGNWIEKLQERQDPYKRSYFWLTGKFKNLEPKAKDTDEWALNNNYISVVPIMNDLTAHQHINALTKIF